MSPFLNFSALFVLIMSTSCSLANIDTEKKVFTERDNDSEVNVPRNLEFEIRLKGNASTGYTWRVTSIDTNLVRQEDSLQYISKNEGIGSDGYFKFYFRTIAAGTSRLKFKYDRQPQNAAKIDSFSITISSVKR